MKRWAQRAAWGIADFLTQCPQTKGVTWWTAALLRFATTGEQVTIRHLPQHDLPEDAAKIFRDNLWKLY